MPTYTPRGSFRVAVEMSYGFETPAAMLTALRVDMDLDDECAAIVGVLGAGSDPNALAWLVAIVYAAGWFDRNPRLRDRLHRLYFDEPAPPRFLRPVATA